MNSSALAWTSTAFNIGTGFTYAVLCFILFRRKLRVEFPFLFAYTGLAAATSLLLPVLAALLNTHSDAYFYIYWVPNVLLILIEFGIMYEVLASLLKPYAGLVDLGKMLFRWAAVFLVLVAGFTAFTTAGSAMTKCLTAVALIERNLRLVQCGLLLLFFLFERRLALSWRGYPVSLALGLGISAAAGLSFTFIRVNINAWIPILDLTESFLTFGIVVYWVHCFARRQPAAQTVLDSPSRLIFQRWNEAVLSTPMTEDANPALATVDSFLPGIEKTVDRVLARKIAN
jgi:hypothetical protein